MDVNINMTSITSFLVSHWGTLILPTLLGFWSYVTTTLSLAVSVADKNNDGTLSNTELEELCLFLIRNSKTPWVKLLPEGIIRRIVRTLCERRSNAFSVEVPKAVLPTIESKKG